MLTESWFQRQARRLCSESLIRRFFAPGGQLIFPLNDHVELLKHHPLGMFFYNQRALVFGIALVGLTILSIGVAFSQPAGGARAIGILWSFWALGIVLTLIQHYRFRKTLRTWAADMSSDTLPRLFDRYFLQDSILIFAMLLTARAAAAPLEMFSWLVLANAVVFAAYISSGNVTTRPARYVMFLLPVVLLTLAIIERWTLKATNWLHIVLFISPLIATLAVTLFSISMTAWRRNCEFIVTRRHMALLGEAAIILAIPDFDAATARQRGRDFRWYRETEFHKRMTAVLARICDTTPNLWYRSASLWLREDHSDRVSVFLPAAHHDFPESGDFLSGIDESEGFLNAQHVQVVRSLQEVESADSGRRWRFRVGEPVPAAIVPIRRGQAKLGALLLFGEEFGPAVTREDEVFLKSLAELIAGAIDQWQTFLRSLALNELDSLFECSNLDDLLTRAVETMKRYLSARGCMIVFRVDPADKEMTVKATAGFNRSLLGAIYRNGEGLTGESAISGAITRIDDVDRNRARFNPVLLRRLEKAHGAKVQSWMSIPVAAGMSGNFGVIKAVNSTYPCPWFTKYDERLGKDLALRLHVMVEKILHVQRTEEASRRAIRNKEQALAAQKKAQETADRRQQEIMTVMHQLQGPLISVVNALSAIDSGSINPRVADLIEHSAALAEDAIALGYGTLTIFAREAGRDTAFQDTRIDAAAELRRLALRLQRTQSRDDLTFTFQQEPDFPKLTMDADAFTSVFYSLIHNAMKYADEGSEVVLQCGFEIVASVRRPALKVKTYGEPIDPAERNVIFEKFKRGSSVDKGKLYKGVGLGLWVARELMHALEGDLTLELSHNNERLAIFVVHIHGAEVYG